MERNRKDPNSKKRRDRRGGVAKRQTVESEHKE